MSDPMQQAIRALRTVSNGYRDSGAVMSDAVTTAEDIASRIESMMLTVSDLVLLLSNAGRAPVDAVSPSSAAALKEVAEFFATLRLLHSQGKRCRELFLHASDVASQLAIRLEGGGSL